MPKTHTLLSTFDTILTWIERAERLWWWLPMSTGITAVVFGGWAWFLERLPEQIAILVLWAIGGMLIVLTYLPPLLRKYRSPLLAITVFAPSFSQQQTSMYMFILNKSPHSRAFIETLLHVPLSNGQEIQVSSDWISVSDKTVPEERSLQSGPQEIGPQEINTNLLIFTLPSLSYRSTPLFTETYLRVIDYMSGRSAKVKIPGKFPPE